MKITTLLAATFILLGPGQSLAPADELPKIDLTNVDLGAELAKNTPDPATVPDRDLSKVPAAANQVVMPTDALADIAASLSK